MSETRGAGGACAEGPRKPMLRASRPRSASATVLAAAAALWMASCTRGGPPLPTRTVGEAVPGAPSGMPAPTVAARSAGGTTPAGDGPVAAEVDAAAPVTATFSSVTFPGGGWAWPGAWSPDGTALIAFVPREMGGAEGAPAALALWTVDAEERSAIWESGDIRVSVAEAGRVADWFEDDVLVVARADDPLVEPDGSPLPAGDLDGQPRGLVVAPDRSRAFLDGPDGAWLLASDGTIRPVQGSPVGGFDGWSWRGDGDAIALSGADGGIFVLDAETATVSEAARRRDARPPDGFAAPRWLADGTILVADALVVETAGGVRYDHRIVDPDGKRSASVADLLGLPRNEEMPRDASGWVAPGGGWLLYPEVWPGNDGEWLARWWLLDSVSRERAEAPSLASPQWDPSGRRIAYRDPAGDLSVFTVESGEARRLDLGGASPSTIAWSPSGRWIAVVDADGALWLSATDVAAGPTRVAEEVDATLPPTFAQDDARLAVTLLDEEGQPELALVEIGIGRP